MGLMDKAKKAVQGRSDKIEKGIDAAAKQVDKRTGGKYADKVAKGAAKAKSRARDLDEERRATGGGVADGGQAAADQRTEPGDRTAPPAGGSPTDPRTSGPGTGGPGPGPGTGGPGTGGTTPAP